MKSPQHRAGERGGGTYSSADTGSLSRSDLCPDAEECRRHWIVNSQGDSADCAFCFQTLSRADLARLLAGTS